MLSRVITTRRENWIGGLATAAALAAGVAVAEVASAQTSLPLQAVGWPNDTVPGRSASQAVRSVCTTTSRRSCTRVLGTSTALVQTPTSCKSRPRTT
jgi:hypothetical protein